MLQQFPAGLVDNNQELFALDVNTPACLTNGGVISFESFGREMLEALESEMLQHQIKHIAIIQMVGEDRLAQIKQYTVCNHGGFDNTPDIVDGKMQAPEYWPCPNRSNCKWEGVACDSLISDRGHILSKREIQVMKLIASGFLDKQIGELLYLAKTTVTTHTKNIRMKTGLFRKADITRYALQKNLI